MGMVVLILMPCKCEECDVKARCEGYDIPDDMNRTRVVAIRFFMGK